MHTLIDTFMFITLNVSSKVALKKSVKYHFKGIASRDLYSKQYFLYERWWFSQFLCFLWRKPKIMFLFALFEITSNYENPLTVTLFRKLVPAFWMPPVTLKVVLKVLCDPWNCPESLPWMHLSDKEGNHDAAFGKIFRMAKCFQENKRKFIIYFSLY